MTLHWADPVRRLGREIAAIRLGFCLIAWLAAFATGAAAAERHQSFDRDPGWDGHNNRSARAETVRQDFGWSPRTAHAGEMGEIGGWITPAAEPAYCAKALRDFTFDDRLGASGTFLVEPGAGHVLIGFFNAGTLNEWRTPNTIALRINQRGAVFHCHIEHCTSRWRAGAGVIGVYDQARDRMNPKELICGRLYRWSIQYDPKGGKGKGVVTATVDDDVATYELPSGHRLDGGVFNRFGLLNVLKQFDGGGRIWLGNVIINGTRQDFASDPHWEERGNRRTYQTTNVRPRFDFGFSPTQYAGGEQAGEVGGLFFRGDCRYAERLAAYGDRLDSLTLQAPLRASGKVSFRRGVSDSTTLFGFYHSAASLWVNPSQQLAIPRDFLGLAIEGPSREGFFFYPVYRNHGDGTGNGAAMDPPRINPDGTAHIWTLAFDPMGAGGKGTITVSLDDRKVMLNLAPGDKQAGAQFDRFGFVTPWIDGNGQAIFFDDLNYTWHQ